MGTQLMDLDLEDLELEDEESTNIESNNISNENVIYQGLSEDTIIPRKGNFLGLDISQNSSGICLYKDGKKYVYNSNVTYDKSNPHAEAFMRKQLKDDLLEVIDGEELDLVVIEDVFEGFNAEVVRKLYALNTAIDDLIIEGQVKCKDFVRVQNGTWKKWLTSINPELNLKGYSDKEKIKKYLSLIGISEDGEGYQDRLDATGMLIGYFLQGKSDTVIKKNKSIKVSFNDISYAFELDTDLIVMNAAYTADESKVIYIKDTKISKKLMIDYISKDISAIYVTDVPIRLGFLADTLGLNILENGGYFGFWLSEKAKKKYLKKIK